MTHAECTRRLLTLTGKQMNEIDRLYQEGNSGRAIARETGVALRNVNAVIQWLYAHTQSRAT